MAAPRLMATLVSAPQLLKVTYMLKSLPLVHLLFVFKGTVQLHLMEMNMGRYFLKVTATVVQKFHLIEIMVLGMIEVI